MKAIGNFFKKYWITILIYLGIFGAYILISINENFNGFLFPHFSKVGTAFLEDFSTLIKNMFSSFSLMIPAVFMATCISIIVGTILGMNTILREKVYPVIYSISVIPAILMSPFALLIAPTFRSASLFLITYNTIWPTLFATINGIMTIDKRYLDNAATLEMGFIKKLFKVIMPAAMPSITSGFITSLRGSFLVLVYAEMYGSKYGMGYYVKKNVEYGMYDKMWAGFVFMIFILVIVMQIFEHTKNRILKWTIN